MANATGVDEALAAGDAALARGAWDDARASFEEVVRTTEGDVAHATAEALEGLSWAAWWLEDVEACLDARERAYLAYRDRGEVRGAARMALWLSDDHMEFRGAGAVAGGWLARARRLLDDLEPCPEHGWLDLFAAHETLERHDHVAARRLAGQARGLGRQLAQLDLEMFGLATEGVAMVAAGEVDAGLQALDEAATAALAGEYDNLVPAAWTCCLVMATCEQVRDYDRAGQWCQQIEAFGRRLDARFLRGVCRAHYGVIQTWLGDWEAAERELVAAVDTLTINRPAWLADATVRLGHLRRRQGRWTEAEALFDQAAGHPLALPGRAAVHLDRGDADTARDLLQRALRVLPPEHRPARADALELLVQARVALDDVAGAVADLEELRSVAAAVRTDALSAAVALAEGVVAAAGGGHRRARDHLADAVDRFVRCGAPVELARSRVELGCSLAALGRTAEAQREVRLALEGLEDLDAVVERDRARALLERLEGSGPARTGGLDTDEEHQVLTPRQVEVLRLVAEGLSDQQIAERLVLSPHTVHRHVANIYVRLGCSSRPAAVAEATRLELL